jgi:aspartate/methionine/tyrosine aminotransferase
MLNSPANPTGIVTSADRLRELAELTYGRTQIVSDEIYHGPTQDESAGPLLAKDSPFSALTPKESTP